MLDPSEDGYGIDIIVPTLGRPKNLQRLATNIQAVTATPYRLTFVVEPHDKDSWHAAAAAGAQVLLNEYEPSYSGAYQTGYKKTRLPYMLNGNDDFEFTAGWDTRALEKMGPHTQVVGINDGKSGCDAIHLIRRSYIQSSSGVMDMPGRVFFPYQHNYVDTEMTATAKHRKVWAAAEDSVIRHMHPDWGFAVDDATYRKSRESLPADAELFRARQHLWNA